MINAAAIGAVMPAEAQSSDAQCADEFGGKADIDQPLLIRRTTKATSLHSLAAIDDHCMPDNEGGYV